MSNESTEEPVFVAVNGRAKETARALLDAAKEAGFDPTVVRATFSGFEVPSGVADVYEEALKARTEAAEQAEAEAAEKAKAEAEAEDKAKAEAEEKAKAEAEAEAAEKAKAEAEASKKTASKAAAKATVAKE